MCIKKNEGFLIHPILLIELPPTVDVRPLLIRGPIGGGVVLRVAAAAVAVARDGGRVGDEVVKVWHFQHSGD